jgi:hypothetical protein
MERVDISVEVGPIDPTTVQQLKDAGFAVYRGSRSWRVVRTEKVVGRDSVRSQAHALARSLVRDYALTMLTDPPSIALRDPDSELDTVAARLLLEDARRASDPDPLPRPPRKWYQRAMELGLGERKG